MNHSMHTADRNTHVKIVAVALFAATFVVGVGLAARSNISNIEAGYAQTTKVLKAGKPSTIANTNASVVR